MSNVKAVAGQKGVTPSEKAPVVTQTDGESHPCDGTLKIECCCPPTPQIVTRTFHQNIGPQSEAALIAFLMATTTAWENAGYLILAHNATDIGAGWMFNFTVGWYV